MPALRLCLIGHPVSHSLSPLLHEATFDSLGISGTYELLDLEDSQLESFVTGLESSNLSGFNVTIPHKEAVYKLVARRSPEALLLKAVNTVRIDSEGQSWAHNTDLGGFVTALTRTCSDLKEKEQALVLGAGGSSRACVAALAVFGFSRIFLAVRKIEPAKELCLHLSRSLSEYLGRRVQLEAAQFEKIPELGVSNILVNTTPVGLDDSESPPPWADAVFERLAPGAIFLDIVYKKDLSETLLMRQSRLRGISCADGFLMLAAQARLAFEFWTGRRPDLADMMSSVKRSRN